MQLIQHVGILALLSLQQESTSREGIRQLADKIGSIIGQQHDKRQQESFDCWFYCPVSTTYGDDLLNNLLVSNALHRIPVVHVTSEVPSFSKTTPHPRLIVVFLDALEEEPTSMAKFLNLFDQNINYIVIFRWTTLSSFQTLMAFLIKLRLFNTLYIPIFDDFDTIELSYNILADRIDTCSINSDESILFPDQFQNMQGLRVSFSAIHDPLSINLATTPPTGTDWLLATTIAEKLNFTIDITRFRCKPRETEVQCYERKLFTANSCFHLEPFYPYKIDMKYAEVITTLIPVSTSIIVPSSGSWAFAELLIKPFELSLVICIILYCAAAMLVMEFRPKLFQNNLILLPFFGFEKSNLHRARWLERWTMLTIVIVTFIIRAAYECKMIAIFTNRPYHSPVKSLDDLPRSGLKVRGILAKLPAKILDDPRLAGVLEDGIKMSEDFEENYGYLVDGRHMAMFTNLMNALTLRFRYTFLPEVLNNCYGHYFFGRRNLFKDKFERLQREIFDVGIYNRWMVLYEWRYMLDQRRIFLSTEQVSEKSLVTFQDLNPVRILFSIGFAVSFVVFCLEIGWQWIAPCAARIVGKFNKRNGRLSDDRRKLRANSFAIISQILPRKTRHRRKSI